MLWYDFADKLNCLGEVLWQTVSDPQPAGGITYPIWSGSTSGSPLPLTSKAGQCSWYCVAAHTIQDWMSSKRPAESLPTFINEFCACMSMAEWFCWWVLQELRHKYRCTVQLFRKLQLFLSAYMKDMSAKHCYVPFIVSVWQLLLKTMSNSWTQHVNVASCYTDHFIMILVPMYTSHFLFASAFTQFANKRNHWRHDIQANAQFGINHE